MESIVHVFLEDGWNLEAYVILNNHYRLMAHRMDEGRPIRESIQRIHRYTVRELNKREGRTGRKIWHQYWETRITYEMSWLARIKYIHQNPVEHGIVKEAKDYPFSSLEWFMSTAPTSFIETVDSFNTDSVNVFEVQ
jgi:putative transposase